LAEQTFGQTCTEDMQAEHFGGRSRYHRPSSRPFAVADCLANLERSIALLPISVNREPLELMWSVLARIPRPIR
jgi:hypothetical protein